MANFAFPMGFYIVFTKIWSIQQAPPDMAGRRRSQQLSPRGAAEHDQRARRGLGTLRGVGEQVGDRDLRHGGFLYGIYIYIYTYMGMDQYLLIPFLGEWTSIYQLFWCSPGVQGFDTLPYGIYIYMVYPLVMTNSSPWKDPPMLLRTVNHVFLWAISHGYLSHNQRVYDIDINGIMWDNLINGSSIVHMGYLWDKIILYDNLSRLEILDGIIWDNMGYIYIYIWDNLSVMYAIYVFDDVGFLYEILWLWDNLSIIHIVCMYIYIYI